MNQLSTFVDFPDWSILDNPNRGKWLPIVIVVGLIYLAVAIASAALAASAPTAQKQFFWRLSAFIISGAVFAAHIAYDHFGLRNTTRTLAWHTSAAVALGAFVLAVVANIHDLHSTTGYRPRLLIALLAWPAFTAVPAFVVSIVIAAVLKMTR